MRIGLFGDIHGNLAALEAVLAALDVEGVDRLVCLGDVAMNGPEPAECLARVAESGCRLVMGNTDAELLDPARIDRGEGEEGRRIAEMGHWAAEQISEAERVVVRTFAPTVEIDLGRERLLCAHGGPHSFDDRILPDTPADELDRILGDLEAPVFAGGHTHVPMVRDHRDVTLINPGSVGLAYRFGRDGAVRVPPWAECAVLEVDEDGRRTVALRRAPYDRAATVRAMHERGMPHAAWWASDWV